MGKVRNHCYIIWDMQHNCMKYQLQQQLETP